MSAVMTENIKDDIKKLRTRRGFCDFLSYLMQWNKDTVLHKDFSLSKHYHYQPRDLSAVNDYESDYHASVWKNALHFLGNGWMVETQVISQKYKDLSAVIRYPDIVSQAIHDERYQQYNSGKYFNTHYRLSISWKPAKQILHHLSSFTLSDTNREDKSHFLPIFEQFEKQCNEFSSYLKKSVISITPLTDNELISFLYQCITSNTTGLNKPSIASFLDCYLSNEDFIGGFEPSIGEKSIAVLALDELPAYSYPCILDKLNHLPCEYRWSSRYIALDSMTAQHYLKRYEKNWSSKAIGLVGVVRESLGLPNKLDGYAQSNVDALIHAQASNASGQVSYGFYNSVIVFMDKDKTVLNELCQQVTSIIQQLNFKVRREKVNACEAYLGSIPAHGDYNLRKMLVDSNYVSHALPTSGFYQGEWNAPSNMQGYNNNQALLLATAQTSHPFALNIHVSDVGHTAILGPTGSGKSTLIGLLMTSHRKYQGSRIIVFDKDYSNKLMTKALGGKYYDLSEQTCQFSPLARIDRKNLASIDEAVNWLSECCYLQKLELNPERKQVLQQAVERLAGEQDCYKNLNHLSVQDPEIRAALNAFNTGTIQHLLNGTNANAITNDIVAFNMGDLINANQQANAYGIAVIKAIFNELMLNFYDQRPTMLVLEEAWLYLKHPIFLNQLTDWFKTLRKANVAVIFISQDLQDIAQSSAASTIQSACMTRIYCPNKSACEPYVAEHYKNFGLNARQIEQIAQAMPKRDYYYQSSSGHTLFQLDLGKIAQSFLCISNKDAQQAFEKIYNNDDKNWMYKWFEEVSYVK